MLATERWAGKPTGAMGSGWSDCTPAEPSPLTAAAEPAAAEPGPLTVSDPVMEELGEMCRALSTTGALDGDGR